jgi:hypothetical protein
MGRSIHIPTAGSPQERVWGICQRTLAQIALKLAMVLFLAFGLTGTTFAIDQPPETASQQRAWLLSHLVTDMKSVGSFTGGDIAQMVTPAIVARAQRVRKRKAQRLAIATSVRQVCKATIMGVDYLRCDSGMNGL